MSTMVMPLGWNISSLRCLETLYLLNKNTVITLPAPGSYVVTLTMYSAKADPESIIITFYAVDAF